MGWRGAVRALNAEIRRQERAAAREAREAEKRWQNAVKAAAADAAAREVEFFQARIDLLTSVHRECGDEIDWDAIRNRPNPPEPPSPNSVAPGDPPSPVDRTRSTDARAVLEAYRPAWWERLFMIRARRRALEDTVNWFTQLENDAEAAQRAAYAEKVATHERVRAAYDAWVADCETARETRELAERVLARDPAAYTEVIKGLDCLREVARMLEKQTLSFVLNEHRGEVTIHAHPDEIAPVEVKSLTKRGAVSTKKMPAAQRMEIYQDYVCGAALRVARELFAALPIVGVLVHVHGQVLNTATGHFEPCVILSVYCPREAIVGANWDRVDASDMVETLLHRMKAKRGTGFVGVEPLEMPA